MFVIPTISNGYEADDLPTANYLTQSNASSTYLTQANATSTYAHINNPSFTGNTTIGTSTSANILNGTTILGAYTIINGIDFYRNPVGVWMIDNSTNWRPIPIGVDNAYQIVSGSTTYQTGGITYTYRDANNLNYLVLGSNTGYNYLPANADCAYFVLPNFGLIVYSQINYQGTKLLNVLNTSLTPQIFAPITNGAGNSWQVVYFDGTNPVALG